MDTGRDNQHDDREASQQVERPARGGFFMVDNEFVDRYIVEVGVTAAAVYNVLARHADQDRECFVSVARIAKRIGMTERAVRAAIRKLTEKGVLHVSHRTGANHKGNLTNIYRLPYLTTQEPGEAAFSPGVNLDSAPPGTAVQPRGERQISPGVNGKSPKQDFFNKTIPNKTNTNKTRRALRFDEADLATAVWMHEVIAQRQPGRKPPKFERWANEIRLLREADKRTDEQIRDLYEWCHNDSFWSTVILSPDKLRAKWDDLELRRSKGTVRAGQGGRSGGSVRLSSPAHVKDPERKYSDETRIPLLAAAEPAKGDPVPDAV